MPDGAKPNRLKPEEVRFLALEGGGGKGFAYLGALQVLETLEVGGGRRLMDNVTGVAGTSAGAITALMLALGMTSEDIQKELESRIFDKFFDPPTDSAGLIVTPEVGGYRSRKPSPCEIAVQNAWRPDVSAPSALAALRSRGQASLQDTLMAVVSPLLSCLGANDSFLAQATQALSWIISGPKALRDAMLAPVKASLVKKNPKAEQVINTLFARLPEYLAYLDFEMGLFSGQVARTYFADLIRRRLEEVIRTSRPDVAATLADDVTFEGLRFLNDKFGLGLRDLLVVGSNLSIGSSVLFSWRHTPDFPIADAVRISMSLPLIYKPYVVSERVDGFPPCGTYVDGGVWNNLPFREIGALGAAPRPRPVGAYRNPPPEPRPVAVTAAERSTLGLRLEIEPPTRVLNAQAVLSKFAIIAGETQVIAELSPFIQILDTRGLDTLLFSPDDETKRLVTTRSSRAMLRYFGQPVPQDAAAEADERETKALLAESVCGGRPRQPQGSLRRSHR